MSTTMKAIACVGLAVAFAAPASADWFPGEPHKMHFPQLPDPTGWDVNGTMPMLLADDWQCSETGPVDDIHIWGSWMHGIPGNINEVRVGIHEDIPAISGDPTSYSQPGNILWAQSFTPSDITVLDPYGTGVQGWYDPASGVAQYPDHDIFHQFNIENIANPFVQNVGEIYWLSVSVAVDGAPAQTNWGWKTSQDHFMGNAVWSAPGTGWNELYDPNSSPPVPLDLAFVITPEPGSLALLLLGGVALARRRRGASARRIG